MVARGCGPIVRQGRRVLGALAPEDTEGGGPRGPADFVYFGTICRSAWRLTACAWPLETLAMLPRGWSVYASDTVPAG
jgi:hypothetical protein